MQPEYIQQLKQHNATEDAYTQRDFVQHFSSKEAQDGLKAFLRQYGHKTLEYFHSSADWQALVPASFQQVIAEYGAVSMIPDGFITQQSEERADIRKRFILSTEEVQQVEEGQPFPELYMEGYTANQQLKKIGAKIVQSYEAAKDLPLDTVNASVRMAMNSFRGREWKTLMHALHLSTSNIFDQRATDKKGNALTTFTGWRDMFDNATSGAGAFATFDEIKAARTQMLRREKDAILPTIVLINASTEAELSDNVNVNSAWFLGSAATYWTTGTLPNIFGLAYIAVPDAHFGYYADDTARDEFTLSNDAFLLAPGATLTRHTRDPMSSETWSVFDRQQRALSLWERYDYSVFKYTNVHRIQNVYGID